MPCVISKGINKECTQANFWASILHETEIKAKATKLPRNKQIIVIGEYESGKSTLMNRLEAVRKPEKGCDIEYSYIRVQNWQNHDKTLLGVWTLNGSQSLPSLLHIPLKAESVPNTLVMLVASMKTPWKMLKELMNMGSILQNYISSLKIPPKQFESYRERIVSKWLDYKDPVCPKIIIDENDRNLPECVLKFNLGLDMVVVITMADYVSDLQNNYGYRLHHFHFMQQWIRRFCLPYGAGLFYTSMKNENSIDVLARYLSHRIYDSPFNLPAAVVSEDEVHIPSGWDSVRKIRLHWEIVLSPLKPDDSFERVLTPPGWKEVQVIEIVAEDEQDFLARMLILLQELDQEDETQILKPIKDRCITISGTLSNDYSRQERTNIEPTKDGVLGSFFTRLSEMRSALDSPVEELLERLSRSKGRRGTRTFRRNKEED